MSYKFKLKLKLPTDQKEIQFHEEKISNQFDVCLDEDISWHDYENNISKYSLEYPETLFMFECDDEHGNMWRIYFKNGKSCEITPRIVWGEFDESQLH